MYTLFFVFSCHSSCDIIIRAGVKHDVECMANMLAQRERTYPTRNLAVPPIGSSQRDRPWTFHSGCTFARRIDLPTLHSTHLLGAGRRKHQPLDLPWRHQAGRKSPVDTSWYGVHNANGRLRRSRGPSSAGSRRVEASHSLAQLCNNTQLLCITFMWFHCSVHIHIYQYGHDHTHRMHKYACHSPIVTCKHMNLQGGMTLRMHIFTHYNSSHVYKCQRISYVSLKKCPPDEQVRDMRWLDETVHPKPSSWRLPCLLEIIQSGH